MAFSHSDLTHRAREYALSAHGDQQYGDKPYSFHLDAVAGQASAALLGDETFVVVAYLHDVVEDTDTTLADLEAHFGSEVALAVSYVTDEPGKNRRERKAATHAKLALVDETTRAGRLALVVKLADRVSNVRSCVVDKKAGLLDMYRKEQEVFRKAVAREGLAEGLWYVLEELLSREVA